MSLFRLCRQRLGTTTRKDLDYGNQPYAIHIEKPALAKA